MARESVNVYEDTSTERLKAAVYGKMLGLSPPWAVLVLLLVAGAFTHAAWGTGPHAVWDAGGIAAAGAVVTVAAWSLSRTRGPVARLHSALSAAGAAGWLTAACLVGPLQQGVLYALGVGGSAMAVVWDLRHLVRHHDEEAGGPEGRLSRWFASVADTAGLGDSRLRVRRAGARKAEGVIILPPGAKTAEDATKAAGRLESGLQFPPGSLSIAPSPDRADHALLTVSDPRAIKDPQPWPGPSRPGASIGEPIRPGLWQDGEDVAWTVPGHHAQVMGMTGSGKSLGACWNYLGEVITRHDAAVLGFDITKGTQTLGPLAPALHCLETTPGGARERLAKLRAAVKARTDYLASKGLQNWQPGCGLTYLVAWLEECPDIIDALGDKGSDEFLRFLKAARSAGIEVDLSLQRSDYTQMPTLARGQLARWCFGVNSSDDAAFGLSELQDERGARPELWASRQPGMAYLDAPSIPDERVAMPMRCWFWGEDDTAIREHAAAYPASARPLDELTASLLGLVAAQDTASAEAEDPGEDDDEPMEAVVSEYTSEPLDGEDVDAGIDDEITVPEGPFGQWQFGEPEAEKLTPAEARERFRTLLAQWADEGREDFAPRDLAPLLAETGMSRAWGHKVLREACEEGLAEPIEDAERGRFGRYRILTREPA